MNLTDKIGEGSQADIYLYRGYAYKQFHSEKKKAGAFFEAAVTAGIEGLGLPVPRVYEVFLHGHKPVIKMDYIAGKDLNKIIVSNPDNIKMYIKMMISLQIQVHSKSTSLPVGSKGKIESQIQKTDALTKEQRERLSDCLKELPDGECLCHGDFHGGNILYCDNHYTIIDWADVSVGHRYADVCRTYMLYSFYSQEIAELYLNMYCSYTDSAKENILQWLPVVAAARLCENNRWEFERIFSWIR